MSFEDFLKGMEASELEAMSGKGETVIGSDTVDDFGQFGEEEYETYDNLFEEADNELGTVGKGLDEEIEELEESSDEVEDTETEEVEEDVDVIEDWDSEIILPNGHKVSARQIQEIDNFNKMKIEVLEEKQALRERENVMALDSDLTQISINSLAAQLQQAAAGRPLNEMETITLNVLGAIGSQINGFKGKLSQTYEAETKRHQQQIKAARDNNIDLCMAEIAEFGDYKSRKSIDDYLVKQGIGDPASLYEQVGYDVRFMKIIRDAARNNMAMSKTSTQERSKNVKGRGFPKQESKADSIRHDPRISPHVRENFASFMELGL